MNPAAELAAYWLERQEPALTVHERKRAVSAERQLRDLVLAQHRAAIASGLVLRPTPAARIAPFAPRVGRIPYKPPRATSLRAA